MSIWENQLNLDWASDESLPDSTVIKSDLGPHLSRLPEELLPAIGKFLYVTKDKTDKVGYFDNLKNKLAENLNKLFKSIIGFTCTAG